MANQLKGIAIAHSKIRIFLKLPEEKRSKSKLVFSNPGYLLVSKQLAFVLTEDVVSNERLRFSLNMHKYDISKMLKDLCAEGFLVSDGIGRGSTYQLNKGENLTNNSANVESSGSNVESSNANVESSSSNVETSDCKKRVKKRCSRNELFNMIVECASEWISLEEIAREVQRSAKYLNNNIINKMVDNGLLKRLISYFQSSCTKI